MFYIGQKVVCINDKDQFFRGLVLGRVYEITDVRPETQGVKVSEFFWWNHDFRFSPDLTDSIEYAEKLLEEITIEINEENLIEK